MNPLMGSEMAMVDMRNHKRDIDTINGIINGYFLHSRIAQQL